MKKYIYALMCGKDDSIEGVYFLKKDAITDGIKRSKEMLKEIYDDDVKSQEKEIQKIILNLKNGKKDIYYIEKHPFSFLKTIRMIIKAIISKKIEY